MYKRSTVSFYAGLTDVPASRDFEIDGDYAEVALNIHTITGSTPTLAVTVVELVNKKLSLPYDGQTANFTVGRTVKGSKSGAVGVILTDTDGGTTGTLVLKQVVGSFKDNETIVEQNVATPGTALVNSAVGGTESYTEVTGNWMDSTALNTAATTKYQLITPTGTAGYKELRPIVPRKFRFKFAKTGTYTNLTFEVELIQTVKD